MMEIRFKTIGSIRTPFLDTSGMPIQTTGAKGIAGTVEIDPEYVDGLKDLEGFSHVILLYHFHLSTGYSLTVRPFMDDVPRGIFSTRAPKRPNSIGFSVVKLIKIEGNTLHIEDVDMVDGTPLLDIKPYVPEFDIKNVERIGWLSGKAENVHEMRVNRSI